MCSGDLGIFIPASMLFATNFPALDQHIQQERLDDEVTHTIFVIIAANMLSKRIAMHSSLHTSYMRPFNERNASAGCATNPNMLKSG